MDADGYVGKIKKDGEVIGRIDIGDDGKAMVYVGETGDVRVKTASGIDFMYSDDDATRMVDALFAVQEPSAADAPLDADRALFQSVIDRTVVTADGDGILSPELAETLEQAYYRNAENPEMVALFEAAVNAYQNAMLEATANLK